MTLEGIRAASKGELLASQHLTAVQAQALTTATLLTEKNVEVTILQ